MMRCYFGKLRFLAAGIATSNSNVKMFMTKDFKFYLANLSEDDLALSSCELAGFNVGSFTVMVTGLDFAALNLRLSLTCCCG